jgi:hypothetical protein
MPPVPDAPPRVGIVRSRGDPGKLQYLIDACPCGNAACGISGWMHVYVTDDKGKFRLKFSVDGCPGEYMTTSAGKREIVKHLIPGDISAPAWRTLYDELTANPNAEPSGPFRIVPGPRTGVVERLWGMGASPNFPMPKGWKGRQAASSGSSSDAMSRSSSPGPAGARPAAAAAAAGKKRRAAAAADEEEDEEV